MDASGTLELSGRCCDGHLKLVGGVCYTPADILSPKFLLIAFLNEILIMWTKAEQGIRENGLGTFLGGE